MNATLAPRQAGSTIKPFTYLLAVQKLGLKPDDGVLDLPVGYQTDRETPYEPKDYDDSYHGPVRIADALASSINIPAVRIAERVGVPDLLDFLHAVGMRSLTESPDHYGLALTLGVGEVSLYELTRAYGIFAHQGQYCDIRILSDAPPDACHPVAETGAVDTISTILSSRYARLKGFPIDSTLDFGEKKVTLKTGTSRNFRDNWTVGYDDSILLGVWAGNKDGENMKGVSGATGAGEIFRRIMGRMGSTDTTPPPMTSPSHTDVHLDPYIEITSPLARSVYRIAGSTASSREAIRVRYDTDISFDTMTILLDHAKQSADSIEPTVGPHTVEIVLMKDGEIVGRQSSDFTVETDGSGK